MKKSKIPKYIALTIFFLAACLFVAKRAAPEILTYYIKSGIGDCRTIPVLCINPEEVLMRPETDRQFQEQLIPYKFNKMSIMIPKGFNVMQETVKKVYYKRRKRQEDADTAYLLYEPPGFFTELFPTLKKVGINDDYSFIRRAMYAHIDKINGLVDAFFVIIKGIFIPNLGSQQTVRMAEFAMPGMRGFINYNLTGSGNYFDCNVFNIHGDFFKIYIRDLKGRLGLTEVFTIISTAKKSD
jgi:hypothetical protein